MLLMCLVRVSEVSPMKSRLDRLYLLCQLSPASKVLSRAISKLSALTNKHLLGPCIGELVVELGSEWPLGFVVVAKSCPTVRDPMWTAARQASVLHCLLELAHIHVH